MTDETDTPTVEVGQNAVAQFVIMHTFESGNIEMQVPEGVERDDVVNAISTSNVERVDGGEDYVDVEGEFVVRRHVRTIPASGGGKLEPPTNPPEAVYEDQRMGFAFRFKFEDLGIVEGRVEAL